MLLDMLVCLVRMIDLSK